MGVHPVVQRFLNATAGLATYRIPDARAQVDVDALLGSVPGLLAAYMQAKIDLGELLSGSFIDPATTARIIQSGLDWAPVVQRAQEVHEVWRQVHREDLAAAGIGGTPRPDEARTNV